MVLFSILSKFLRWFVVLPFVVVITLNFENAVSDNWLATVLADNAQHIPPMIAYLYSIIVAPWVIYPLIFLSGILSWDIVYYWCKRLDRPGSRFEKWMLRNKAGQAAMGFKKDGFYRKHLAKTDDLHEFNKYLRKAGLPLVPRHFPNDERLNTIFWEYCRLIQQGKSQVGMTYLEAALLKINSSTRLHL